MADDPILICHNGSIDAARAIDTAAALLRRRRTLLLDLAATIAWESIVEAADEVDAAAIVVGAGGSGRPRELAQRIVSHDVAERSKRPVLSLSRPRRGDARDVHDAPILICYDGSEYAREAIEAAAALMRPRGAVVLDATPLRLSVGYATIPSDAPWVDEVDGAVALERAEEGAALARQLGFDAEPSTKSARTAWQAVTDVADEVGAAAIVIGSGTPMHRREVAEHSLSHAVAAHARRPTLIVPQRRG